jgi:hypothetical protein
MSVCLWANKCLFLSSDKGKGKVVSLCATMVYGGMEVSLHQFLTLALDGGEWSASCLRCFTSGEQAVCMHWIGGWVGPRADLDPGEEKHLLLLLVIEAWFCGHLACSLVMLLTVLSQLTLNCDLWTNVWKVFVGFASVTFPYQSFLLLPSSMFDYLFHVGLMSWAVPAILDVIWSGCCWNRFVLINQTA